VKARDLGEGRLRFGGIRGDRRRAMTDHIHNLNLSGARGQRKLSLAQLSALGKARAANLTPERRSEIANKAVAARKAKRTDAAPATQKKAK
jgi:hypothetical protein